ncbi:MAG TPA: O-antigen ligase family protein [Chloroflexota bacterium]|nr:O-antigen ligase family protein [Chloroflexota bacterium]
MEHSFEARLPRARLPAWVGSIGLAVVVGAVLGVAVSAATPLYVVGGLLGLVAYLAILADVRNPLYGFIAVATLVPFVVVPVKLGVVQLSLVEICLITGVLLWLLKLLTDRREVVQGTGIDLPLLAYLAVCLTSFVLGTAYQTTSTDVHLFTQFINALLLVFVVANVVRDIATVRKLLTWFVIAGAAASVIAIALYYLPAATATRLLASLAKFGYPANNILQYDADTHVLKAIGTSIDHNILGATTMMCGAIGVGMLARPIPWRKKAWILACLGPLFVALLLTYSRGSLVGFLAGCAVIATLRYRRIWLIGGLLAVALVLSGQLASSSFYSHLQTGIEVQDQATQMRFGEYKDALHLISEYPWFGVGFGAAPDVDTYLGVSSIYLMIAENVGLVGLACWVWIYVAVFQRALRGLLGKAPNEARTYAVACLATLTSVLVAGIFDHHFVDINFPHDAAMVWLVVGLLVVSLRLGEALDS